MKDFRSVQKELDVVVDGIWGPKTQHALNMQKTCSGVYVPPWMAVAAGELLVRETPGARATPRILDYFRVARFATSSDETAWCSAFVNFCVKESGLTPTYSVAARSWTTWGRDALAANGTIPYGSIVVLWRTSPTSWEGHVGFAVDSDAKNIRLLGGNQSNACTVADYPRSRLLAARLA